MSKSIQLFKLGEMKRIIILGMGWQLLIIAKFCQQFNIKIQVFTGLRHKDMKLNNNSYIVKELESIGVTTIFCSSLHECMEGPYYTVDAKTLVFSIGSPFIIKQDLIDLYKGRVINSHGAPLPKYRGGGGLSWRMLAGCNIGVVLYHLVSPVIDNGKILYQRKYVFPMNVYEIKDWLDILENEETRALIDFLSCLKNGEFFSVLDQKESESSYFPRLDSSVHGYINFEWDGEYIERFIKAFSNPYSGAMTYVNGFPVRILNAKYSSKELYDHPFFNGLVIRIINDNYYICVEGGVLEVPINSIISSHIIKVGDRLFTPRENIERALTHRVIYTPNGLRRS